MVEQNIDTFNVQMPLVYICSPLLGDYEGNTEREEYCRAAVEMGVVPVTPHLIFPQFLDDTVPAERTRRQQMDLELLARCNELWVCTPNISEGMNDKIEAARHMRIPIRRFYPEQKELSQPLYQYTVNNSAKGVVNQPLPSVISI